MLRKRANLCSPQKLNVKWRAKYFVLLISCSSEESKVLLFSNEVHSGTTQGKKFRRGARHLDACHLRRDTDCGQAPLAAGEATDVFAADAKKYPPREEAAAAPGAGGAGPRGRRFLAAGRTSSILLPHRCLCLTKVEGRRFRRLRLHHSLSFWSGSSSRLARQRCRTSGSTLAIP